jgi:hypothetical protein
LSQNRFNLTATSCFFTATSPAGGSSFDDKTQLWDWFDDKVVGIFSDPVCGNGLCEGPTGIELTKHVHE